MATARKPAAALLPAVIERAAKIRSRGKTVTLPPAADMPPAMFKRLDGTIEACDRILQFGLLQTGRSFAWMHIASTIEALASHPKVAGVPAAVDFVAVVGELARNAMLADTAAEALEPVDGLLPMGAKGAKFKPGRPKGSVGSVRLFVRQYMARHGKAAAAEVWLALKARPPAGVIVRENRIGKYIETSGAPDTSYRAFANIVTKERPK